MIDQDLTDHFQHEVSQAIDTRRPLLIVGGGTKAFYGGICHATAELEMVSHSGIIDYDPSELVMTARSGTRLDNIASLLSQHGQMLAFEPPFFGERATLGGTVACGFSGPRRPFAGSVRDFMLGCKIINGNGEVLHFGGKVMKNVAGFDVSRLMAGALGTLGVLLEISLRVLPAPESELTLTYALSTGEAIKKMNELSAQPWPLSALAYDGQFLRVRLSGAETALRHVTRQLGGEIDVLGESFWCNLREHQLDFFQKPADLWRFSVAPATPPLTELSGDWLLNWGGAERWLKTCESADTIHTVAAKVGGHAICFQGDNKSNWIRLDPALFSLNQRIRNAFDPFKLFNPDRLLG